MKQTYSFTPHRTIAKIYLFLFVMMAAGSIFDYPISCALYDENNPIAIFFAAFGECPAYLGLTAAGTMTFVASHRRHTLAGALQRLGGMLLIISGGILTCNTPGNYLDWPTAASITAGILMTVLTVAATFFLCRGADQTAIQRVALAFLLAILGQLLLVNLLKILWGRARMRLVVQDSRVYFMPWWQPDRTLKATLTAGGVDADEFKSFPSGHTADATMAMLAATLPCIAPKLEIHQKKLFGLGFITACITGFTRIIMGAHYLTDVAAGFLCGFTIMLLSCRLLPGKKAA